MNLEIIDIVFIVLILIMGFAGFKVGFFSQIITIVGIIIGLFLGYFFCDDLSIYLVKVIGEHDINNLISFIIIFIVTLIVSLLINKLTKTTLENLGAGGFNKILGFSFGMIQGVIICIGVTALLTIQPFWDPEPIFLNSILGSRFIEILPELEKILPSSEEFLNSIGTEI